MREIKFRGLTTRFYQKPPEKEWVYGSLQISYDGLARIIPLDPAGPWDGVEPETVGQYTGLKDKNGVEICEGDVVSISYFGFNPVQGVVKYRKQSASYKVVLSSEIFSDLTEAHVCEIIGNVFDKPELKERFWKVWEENQK